MRYLGWFLILGATLTFSWKEITFPNAIAVASALLSGTILIAVDRLKPNPKKDKTESTKEQK